MLQLCSARRCHLHIYVYIYKYIYMIIHTYICSFPQLLYHTCIHFFAISPCHLQTLSLSLYTSRPKWLAMTFFILNTGRVVFSGGFSWVTSLILINPPDLLKQQPHTQACFYLLLWNSFFAMGAYMHTCAFFSYLVPVIIFTDWPIHTYCYRTNLACWWCSGHNSVFFPF